VARRVIVHIHVHAANVPYTCRHARGADEWTTASDDGRVRRRPGRPGSASECPHAPDPHNGHGPQAFRASAAILGVLGRWPAPVTGGSYVSAPRSNRVYNAYPREGNTFVISAGKKVPAVPGNRDFRWHGQVT
jgi:hypothetical protein